VESAKPGFRMRFASAAGGEINRANVAIIIKRITFISPLLSHLELAESPE
jgi:hypothetical protein